MSPRDNGFRSPCPVHLVCAAGLPDSSLLAFGVAYLVLVPDFHPVVVLRRSSFHIHLHQDTLQMAGYQNQHREGDFPRVRMEFRSFIANAGHTNNRLFAAGGPRKVLDIPAHGPDLGAPDILHHIRVL